MLLWICRDQWIWQRGFISGNKPLKLAREWAKYLKWCMFSTGQWELHKGGNSTKEARKHQKRQIHSFFEPISWNMTLQLLFFIAWVVHFQLVALFLDSNIDNWSRVLVKSENSKSFGCFFFFFDQNWFSQLLPPLPSPINHTWDF